MCYLCPRTPVTYVSGPYTWEERGARVLKSEKIDTLVSPVGCGQRRAVALKKGSLEKINLLDDAELAILFGAPVPSLDVDTKAP